MTAGAVKDENKRARQSASAGAVFSGMAGSGLLIIGAGMQWGLPAAFMAGGVCFLVIAVFFVIAFHQIISM